MLIQIRVINEKYKEQYLKYLVVLKKILLNKDLKQLEREMERLNKNVLWINHIAERVSFTILLNAFLNLQKVLLDKLKQEKVLALHPDNINENFFYKLSCSVFLQSWIPYLSSDDAEMAIELCGLKSEYQTYIPQKFYERKCGQCGTVLNVLDNSEKILCDNCGHIIDVQSDEFSCINCGALLSLPIDATKIICPYCKTVFNKAE